MRARAPLGLRTAFAAAEALTRPTILFISLDSTGISYTQTHPCCFSCLSVQLACLMRRIVATTVLLSGREARKLCLSCARPERRQHDSARLAASVLRSSRPARLQQELGRSRWRPRRLVGHSKLQEASEHAEAALPHDMLLNRMRPHMCACIVPTQMGVVRTCRRERMRE